MADNAGLLFRIKSVYDDKGTKQAQADIKGLEIATAGAGESLASLAGPAAAAAAIIAAVGLAALSATEKLFDLAKQAAEFGSALKDVQDKTGLTAESLSTLKLNADQSGSSIEKIGGSVAKFNVLLGQAENGNQKAQQTLKQYGVTAKDTDTALQQAVKTIGQMGSESQQAAAAAALFKDRTGEILPVIKQMDGDLAKATETTKKLGLAMSQEAIDAADALGDQLTVLDAQLKMVEVTIGTALIPTVLDLARTFSNFLSENKSEIASWASFVGFTVHNVVLDIKEFISNLRAAASIAGKIAAGDYIGAAGDAVGGAIDFGNLDKSRNTLGAFGSAGGRLPGGGGGTGGGGGSRGDGGGSRKDDRLALMKAAAQEEIQLTQEKNKTILEGLKLSLKQGTITEEEELAARQKIEEDFFNIKLGILQKELAAVKGNAKETARVNTEITLTSLQKTYQQIKDQIEIEDKKDAAQKASAEVAEQMLKREIELRGQILEQEQKQLEISKQLGIASADQLGLNGLPDPEGDDAKSRTAGDIQNLRGDAIGSLLDKFKDNGAAVAGISAIADAFGQLGQAVGQTVEALVLYGNAGGNLRQVTAKILASVASQAAVKAIFELAEGLACLALAFFGDPAAGAAAPFHFAAAAAYGAIAGVAGLAGRAVAGNSFNQASGKATGGSASSGPSGSNPNAAQNQPYSRSGPGAFDSGLRGTFDRLNANLERMDSMPVGHVVTLGAKTTNGSNAIGHAAVASIGRNAAIGKQLNVRLGNR